MGFEGETDRVADSLAMALCGDARIGTVIAKVLALKSGHGGFAAGF